jgi:glycosyltransferase involved in cell wall biosynthesis
MSADQLPLVSIVIPARNEAADIVRCLDHVAAQDYPHDRLEVVVVDGASTDQTALVAARALEGHGFHHSAVLRNAEATTPSNLNVGLRYATGEIVCRVDARSLIEPHHVRTCAALLTARPEVSVVGGAQIAQPRDGSCQAIGIARALNNRWSMGGSRYRRQSTSGPCDTVYLGAFRRAQLMAEHGWDERLGTNQDFDLNRRMAAHGEVWFEASLRTGYVPRATYAELWGQYRRFGQAKVDYWQLTGDRPQRRQELLLAVPVAGAAVLAGAAAKQRLGHVVLLGLLALLGIEVAGGERRRRTPLLAHVTGAVAMVCVGAGWTFGAWRERVRR